MILYLVRGLPGSGKSTYARNLGCFHVEADMFHVKNGVYQFDFTLAKLAHNWCLQTAWSAMERGMDVVVSNTFTQKKEIEPYLGLADKSGHSVKIFSMAQNHASVHAVPEEVLTRMAERWEKIEGEDVV